MARLCARVNLFYLAKREAREKVVLYREQVPTEGHQRMSLGHFLQLEWVEVPLVHLSWFATKHIRTREPICPSTAHNKGQYCLHAMIMQQLVTSKTFWRLCGS